jgi:hypothetical protein
MDELGPSMQIMEKRQNMERKLREVSYILRDRADALEAIGLDKLSVELRDFSKEIWKASEESQRLAMEELDLRIESQKRMSDTVIEACLLGGNNE